MVSKDCYGWYRSLGILSKCLRSEKNTLNGFDTRLIHQSVFLTNMLVAFAWNDHCTAPLNSLCHWNWKWPLSINNQRWTCIVLPLWECAMFVWKDCCSAVGGYYWILFWFPDKSHCADIQQESELLNCINSYEPATIVAMWAWNTAMLTLTAPPSSKLPARAESDFLIKKPAMHPILRRWQHLHSKIPPICSVAILKPARWTCSGSVTWETDQQKTHTTQVISAGQAPVLLLNCLFYYLVKVIPDTFTEGYLMTIGKKNWEKKGEFYRYLMRIVILPATELAHKCIQ